MDRTFQLYRRNFPLFAGIAVIPAATYVLMLALQSLLGALSFWPTMPATATPTSPASVAGLLLIYLVLFPLYFGVALLSHGAGFFAVADCYLHTPSSIGACYRRVRPLFWRLLWLGLLLAWRLAALPALAMIVLAVGSVFLPLPWKIAAITGVVLAIIGGFVYIILQFLKYALALPASVLEDLPAKVAIRRSVILTAGDRSRIFIVYLLITTIGYGTFSVLILPAVLFGAFLRNEHAAVIFAVCYMVSAALVGAVVTPLSNIALALLYYDERVRKEAFDIDCMLAALGSAAPATAAEA